MAIKVVAPQAAAPLFHADELGISYQGVGVRRVDTTNRKDHFLDDRQMAAYRRHVVMLRHEASPRLGVGESVRAAQRIGEILPLSG
jgi:hypothetical protein